ncbi:MAG: hypothetical protein ABI662_00665 [Dermatophilaceae bacterium]
MVQSSSLSQRSPAAGLLKVLSPAIGPLRIDREVLAARMIATLSAELEGKVAHDLVADVVQAVLDEGRQDDLDREARQRLDRFARAARTSV